MARNIGGHTKRTVNQMNAAKTIACATSVKLMFMRPSASPDGSGNRSADLAEQRVAGGEPQGQAHADDERSVDQAEQEEHLCLQRVRQLGLARRGLEEPRAH